MNESQKNYCFKKSSPTFPYFVYMIENLPSYIPSVFILTTILTLVLCFWIFKGSSLDGISGKSIYLILILIAWLSIQAFFTIKNIYSQDITLPPKIFLLGILPFILFGLYLFNSKKGKNFIDSLSIEKLCYLNLVRIPVEFVLLWLYLQKTIPQILTFEGWNFDIIMGLTAPIIIHFGYRKKNISKKLILAWNVIGVLLLAFVFIIAVLSAPYSLQQLAFDQPNIGLLKFPFSWLPTFIVPIVIIGHLISIRQLTKKDHI